MSSANNEIKKVRTWGNSSVRQLPVVIANIDRDSSVIVENAVLSEENNSSESKKIKMESENIKNHEAENANAPSKPTSKQDIDKRIFSEFRNGFEEVKKTKNAKLLFQLFEKSPWKDALEQNSDMSSKQIPQGLINFSLFLLLSIFLIFD